MGIGTEGLDVADLILADEGVREHLELPHTHVIQRACGTETGSYLRIIDSCITQLKAQGPARTCNESKEGEEEGVPVQIGQCSAGQQGLL